VTTPTPSDNVLSASVEIETPELVVLSYTIAGIGSRAAAALIDMLVVLTLLFGIGGLLSRLGSGGEPARAAQRGATTGTISESLIVAITIIFIFLLFWGYYVLCEALADGRTLGKRVLGLRVVRDGGYSIDFGAAAVRNLVRVVDMQPVAMYLVGTVSVLLSRTGKRLGDYAAGTMVVRESFVRRAVPDATAAPMASETPSAEAVAVQPPLHTALTDEEFTLLERFLERRRSLSLEARQDFASRLAERFRQALPSGDASPEALLVALHASESEGRARGAAGKRTTGAAREKHAIIAAGSPRWNRVASKLAQAQRGGLVTLGESGVRDFVGEYRDLSADLARLRTASRGERSEEIFYLSRLIAGAHNVLYRRRTTNLWQALRFLSADVPREIRRSWRPILLAAALLFGPMLIAYTAVVRDPDVAPTFIPDGMIERANQGIRRAREGTGYIPDPQVFRPVMASGIVANNVQVTFVVFAGGILLALPSTLMLVMNGVSIGGILGLYQSRGIGSLLVKFVAPHGVLELTAICIAGGGAFLLAAGVLLPGMRTRRRALAENGRRAIRLIAGSTLLLIVAGTLEGFVSPIPSWSLGAKLAVSAATAVALIAYLSGGRTRAPRTEQSADAASVLDLR
jgi:uncharacterized membrane protein SpoIIM required for sporulation/uncharacterized RDD family membrane protein YckC